MAKVITYSAKPEANDLSMRFYISDGGVRVTTVIGVDKDDAAFDTGSFREIVDDRALNATGLTAGERTTLRNLLKIIRDTVITEKL